MEKNKNNPGRKFCYAEFNGARNMILIINSLYLVSLLMFSVTGLFIVFHIVKYSYSKPGAFFMLCLFLPVTAVLIFLNAALFFAVDFEEAMSYLFNA